MERYRLSVYTRPVPGQEGEFHRWYNEVHLAEVLEVPGFVYAERWALRHPAAPVLVGNEGFLATFTIFTDDIEATLCAFEEARRSMTATPSLDSASVTFELAQLLPS